MSKKDAIKSFISTDLKHTRAALNKLEKLLNCSRCKKIPENPHILGNCDCVYCLECAQIVNGDCLSCKAHSFSKDVAPDNFMANVIVSYKSVIKAIDKAKPSEDEPTQDTVISASHVDVSNEQKRRNPVPLNKLPTGISDPSRERHVSKTQNDTQHQVKPVDVPQAPVPAKDRRLSDIEDKSKPISVTNPGLLKRNNKGETLLHLACIVGRLDKVKDLLSQGANPNVKDNAGWTPLHEAIVRNNLNVAEVLLNAGAHPSAAGGDNLDTPLHEAASSGFVSAIELLITRGANPYSRNLKGKSPVECAGTEVLKQAMKRKATVEIYKTWRPSFFEPGLSVVMSLGSRDEQTKVKKLCTSLGAKTAASLSDKVSHLVIHAVHGKADTSLEVYIAMVRGLWIVDSEWIQKSAEKQEILDPALFEIQGVRGSTELEAPSKARRFSEYKLPGLFSGCSIYLHGNFVRFAKTELNNLIRYGDGTVLNRSPDPERISDSEKTVPYHAQRGSSLWECSHFVVFDPSSRVPEIKYKMAHIKTLPLNWLLDSIENFKLMDIERPEYCV